MDMGIYKNQVVANSPQACSSILAQTFLVHVVLVPPILVSLPTYFLYLPSKLL